MEEQLQAVISPQPVDMQVTLNDLQAAVDRQNKLESKRLFYQRATLAVLSLIFVLFAGAAIYLVPMLQKTLDGINAATAVVAAADVEAVVGDIDALTKQGLTTMQDISDSIVILQKFDVAALNQAVGELSSAVESLKNIDVDTLNAAIANLNASVEPLAKFFGVFKK